MEVNYLHKRGRIKTLQTCVGGVPIAETKVRVVKRR
jgi:hypothetical protein